MKNINQKLLLTFLALSVFACKKEESIQPVSENAVVTENPVTIEEEVSVINTKPSTGTNTLKGDGVTDNRAALQSLINSYASKKTSLVLPAGKFLISNELNLPINTSIEGAGDKTEIILSSGTVANRRVFKINKNQHNIRIMNLKANANQAANTGGSLAALYTTEAINGLYVENVSFAGARDYGSVQIKGLNAYPVTKINFINCRFLESGRTALELRGTKDVVISGCTFANWGSQNPNSPALQLQSQDNINVQIKSNTFNNKYGVQFAIECAAAYVLNATISDNKLNDVVNLGGNGISGYFKNTIITRNVMSGGKGHQRSGLEIFGSYNTLTYNTITAGNIAISGNKTEDGTGIIIENNNVKTKGDNVGGIMLGGGGYNLNTVRIAKNIVDTRLSNGNSSAIVLGTYGATRAVSNITVESNTLYTKAHCFRLQALAGSKNIYLTNNACKAGSTWLAVLTNTFTNIQPKGNIIDLTNKSITYGSTSIPKITIL